MYNVCENECFRSTSSTNSLSVEYFSKKKFSNIFFRIILNLICFIAPIGSLRSVSETLFQRLCLSQTTNERSDLVIVLNEVMSQLFELRFVSSLLIGDYESIIDLTYLSVMDSSSGSNQ